MASEKSLQKLKILLEKKFSRVFLDEEVVIAYRNLMRFAYTLIDLSDKVYEKN